MQRDVPLCNRHPIMQRDYLSISTEHTQAVLKVKGHILTTSEQRSYGSYFLQGRRQSGAKGAIAPPFFLGSKNFKLSPDAFNEPLDYCWMPYQSMALVRDRKSNPLVLEVFLSLRTRSRSYTSHFFYCQ